MGMLGILLSLAGLMYFAYRGVNVLILAPIMALLAGLFDPAAPFLASYTQVFMPALGEYLLKYFPLFLLGSIFGKLMGDSGAAAVIGEAMTRRMGHRHAPMAVILSCALLTYGGVSLFVVAFCIYPIAQTLFRQANIPKKLIPGCIALGAFTFTMTALPGTPAIQNAIPMPFFGTTAFAAPGLGVIAGLVMLITGWLWIERRAQSHRMRNEGFLAGEVVDDEKAVSSSRSDMPLWQALVPLVAVVGLNYLFSKQLFPAGEFGYLSDPKFGGVELKDVIGLWSIIASISLAVLLLLILQRPYLESAIRSINEGTMGSLLPIFNTASEVGYGATIASLASFAFLKDSVLGLFPKYPLVSEAISINLLAGITGSASGGLSIALKALGNSYLDMAQQAGISPELMHRVASLACGGLDTLPHNGAVITLLTICGLTHKQSYLDIFVVAVVGPFFATSVVVVLGSLFGSF